MHASLRLLAASSLLVAASAGAQNLVSNGSFEQPAVAGNFVTYGAGNGITNWTIASGSVDLIHDYWQAAQGAQSIDMNGNAPAVLSQFVPTLVGGTYNLTFQMAGNPDGSWNKAMNVYWNGSLLGGAPVTFVQGSNTRASMGWMQVSFSNLAASTTSTELRFEGIDTGNGAGLGPYIGAALDDVSVTTATTATPEPATYALMGSGLIAIAGVARRRRQRSA